MIKTIINFKSPLVMNYKNGILIISCFEINEIKNTIVNNYLIVFATNEQIREGFNYFINAFLTYDY